MNSQKGLILFLLVILVMLGLACGGGTETPILSFEDVTQEAGLYEITRTYSAAAADYNADGYPDLAISHHGHISIRKNLGDGKFEDVSKLSDLLAGDTHGISFVDINNDGKPDLGVAVGAQRGRGSGANSYYVNDGTRFTRLIELDAVLADPLGRGRTLVPADINGDGSLDLFVFNLYQENRNHRIAVAEPGNVLTFEDVGPSSGLDTVRSSGVVIADLNNNGENYYILSYGWGDTGSVYRITGEGTFENISLEIGLGEIQSGINAVCPFDYDNDGDFDLLFIRGGKHPSGAGTYDGRIYFHFPHRPQIKQGFKTTITVDGPIIFDARFDDARFDILSPFDGLKSDDGKMHALNLFLGGERQKTGELPWVGRITDEVLDGSPDVNPETDSGGYLWRNAEGQLVYEFVSTYDVQVSAGFLEVENQDLESVIELNPKEWAAGHSLYRNDDGYFVDVTEEAGFSGSACGADAITTDFNNDGFIDVYIVNSSYGNDFGKRNLDNQLYLNNGDGTFADIARTVYAEGPSSGAANGAVAFDYDQDGDIDLFLYNGAGPPWPLEPGPLVLLQNNSEQGNFIELDILSTTSNSRSWGVRVLSVVGDRILYQQKCALNGHLSTSDLPIHIGLGTEDEAREIEIIWPSGKTKTLRSVPAGSRLIIKEPS